MRILHVNTYDKGGAANAALRLHKDLLKRKIDSRFLLLQKSTDTTIENNSVFFKNQFNFTKWVINKIENIIALFLRKKNYLSREEIKVKIRDRELEWFSFPDTGIDITNHPEYEKAEIINFHWIADFPDYSFFKKNNKPVVWTLHDMAPFTGGCHYSEGCKLFLSDCFKCHLLSGMVDSSITQTSLKYKLNNLPDYIKLNIVAPSKWLLNLSKESKLFKNVEHYHIPYGIDSSLFKKYDKIEARTTLGLPKDKCILLFVAFYNQDLKRKGFDFLNDAFALLKNETVVLCSVGNAEPQANLRHGIIDLGLILDENQMSMVYSAADVFIIPSIEDNLPNTVLESIMCGTPVIGFSVGGIKDMIQHGENGYLVEELNSVSLAEAINLFLEDRNNFDSKKIREQAIKKYEISVQSNSYIELYKKILNES